MEIQPVVVGTAGHIDHGKSTLVRALTGIDPDRLKEEKERGLTIDLGFANFELSDGRRVGIVDVPGHERFIRNMVAGATGIDLVVLVVAADDGVMPQTREHLAIMQLLGIERGVVALNKIDAVDPELVELAREDVRELLAGTFLEDAPILPVSGLKGAGVEELRAAISELATSCPVKSADGIFRMPVQRVFSKQGFGTVTTGIPVSGRAKVGDVLEVQPGGVRAKVRAIHAYGREHGEARAGHSSALNLTDLGKDQVHRGFVVATPGYFEPARMVAARVTLLGDLPRPVKDRTRVRLHTGTAQPTGEMVLLDAADLEPGGTALCQLRLDEPVVVAPGDRFVVRLLSPEYTLGGGQILEESRHRLKRFKSFVIDELSATESSLDREEDLLATFLLRRHLEPTSLHEAAAGIKRDDRATQDLLDRLVERKVAVPAGRARNNWLHTEAVEEGLARIAAAVDAWFAEHPQRLKAPLLEIRRGCGLEQAVFGFLTEIAAERGVYDLLPGGELAIAGRAIESDPESDAAHAALLSTGLQPPPPAEFGARLGGEKQARALFERLVDLGRAVRISPDFYLAAEEFERAKDAVVENCGRNGQLVLPELREKLDTTRKWLIPLLEHLDAIGLTMRQGATRVLKGR